MNLAQFAKRAAPPWSLGLLAAVVLLLFVGIVFPVFNGNRLSPGTKVRRQIGLVWLALHLYAGDNEDKLPAKLSDLCPTYLPPGGDQLRDPQTGKQTDWLYYPGHTLHDPVDTILVASPFPVIERTGFFMHAKYRVITTVNTSTGFIPEAEFQRRVSALLPPR